MKQHFITQSDEQTEELAEKIGARLRGGEIIELVSDVGGGKTTFVRGLARGAGSSDAVASPTFTVSRLYEAENFAIHHFDLYRLQDAGLLEHELEEVIGDVGTVVVVEWGESVQHVLPSERLRVLIKKTGENQRELALEAPDSIVYLTEGLL